MIWLSSDKENFDYKDFFQSYAQVWKEKVTYDREVINADNGFNGKVIYENGEYLSTKSEHSGFGLKSIAGIAEKYNGEAEFTHENLVFHSSVILEFAAPSFLIN